MSQALAMKTLVGLTSPVEEATAIPKASSAKTPSNGSSTSKTLNGARPPHLNDEVEEWSEKRIKLQSKIND